MGNERRGTASITQVSCTLFELQHRLVNHQISAHPMQQYNNYDIIIVLCCIYVGLLSTL